MVAPSAFIFFCLLIAALSVNAKSDLIKNLPGLDFEINFNQYAGYLDIQDQKYPDTYRHIFYWFVESQNDPSVDPLIFWSNGGPGCSGLMGMLEEFGPLLIEKDGKTLRRNPYAWNLNASIVFIESPAGVGFSYSDYSGDYDDASDENTATDNLQVVLAFLKKYDTLKDNRVYLASESYGGHYIPTWTLKILDSNDAGENPHINFGGFLIGNPYTNPSENIIGLYGTLAGHALIPPSLWSSIQTHCLPTFDSKCKTYTKQADSLVSLLDIYSLDTDMCLSSSLHSVTQQRRALKQFIDRSRSSSSTSSLSTVDRKRENRQRRRLVVNNNDDVNRTNLSSAVPTFEPYDPCVPSYTKAYLNQDSVIAAIHASLIPVSNWYACSSLALWDPSDDGTDMVPLYPSIISRTRALQSNVSFLIYSGDDDSVCGALGTESWLLEGEDTKQVLGEVLRNWTAWTMDEQVAGYSVVEFMSFVTVHSAGHEVAMRQPIRALEVVQRFLRGEWNSGNQ